MIATISKSDVSRVLDWAQGVSPSRSSTPALLHVLLVAEKDALTVTATDLDMVLTCSIPAEVTQPGEIIVPARILADIVRKMPQEHGITVTYNHTKNCVKVACASSHFSLPLFSEKFLLPKTTDMPHNLTMPTADFLHLLRRTAFAMSTNSADYVLSGVCINAQLEEASPRLQSMASDRRKFALADVPLPDHADTLPSIIVPKRSVLELVKILEDLNDETISLSCSLVQIAVSTQTVRFSSRLISGTFPPYDVSVPKSNPHKLHLDTKLFLSILDRVATIYYQDATPWVELAITADSLTLYCESNNSGKAEESLSIAYDGNPITLCYNVRFLLDIVQNIRADSIELLVSNNPNVPVLMQGLGENALYLLMPLLRNKLVSGS